MTTKKPLSDPERIKQSKHDLLQALEAQSTELRQPKWNYWRQIVKVKLWQAVALSVGVEPDLLDRFIDVGYPYLFDGTNRREFESVLAGVLYRIEPRCAERMQITESHIEAGNITPRNNKPSSDSPVELRAFAAWAVKMEWEVPPELASMANIANAKRKSPAEDKPLSIKERENLLRIIGVLYEIISGNAPTMEKHPKFKSQAKLIEFVEAKYTGMGGMGKRNLENVLAQAKNLLSQS